jgi:hypothetical protein
MRRVRAPTRAENASMSTVIGRSAVPATKGEYPETTCSCNTSSTKMAL